MKNLNEYIITLQKYAEFADSIGDFQSADQCFELLREAENYNNSNIKTAMERTAIFKKLWRGIKSVGKGIDKFVRKNLGGWSTIALIAAAPYLAKLAPQLKGIGKQVVDAIKSGKNPLDLMKSKNPLVAKIAGDFLKNMQQQAAQGQQAAGQPTTTTGTYDWGQKWTTTDTSSTAKIQSSYGLLVDFKNTSISQLISQPTSAAAQSNLNEIKRSGVVNLKKAIVDMDRNQNSPNLNLIDPTIQSVIEEVNRRKQWNLR